MSPPLDSPPNITITPTTSPQDYTIISALENRVFYNDPFTIVAFGPERGSAANIEQRAKGLAKQPSEEGERTVVVKAVLRSEDGEDVIVGAAQWRFVTGRDVERGDGGEENENVEEETTRENGKENAGDEGGGEEKGNGWGIGANVKFCEDVFLVADEHMIRSTEGENYAKLTTLIVTPEHQRCGIGQQILSRGLQEVDRFNLQCVLGASKEGLGLYKRFGFVEFETMKLRLWEYDGGDGFEEDDHVVMWRPAQSI